jgi:tetratricopeptide (TPR) repeat protein
VVEGAETLLSPGEVVGDRYRVLEQLGAGAMGTVYRVLHTEIEVEMALKLLHPELSLVPSIEERFNREARSAAMLDDPRIVRVTDFGRSDAGALYMVMELLDGRPMSELVEGSTLSAAELIQLVDQVLSALEHAHDQGVVHRDLKPDNIMLLERRGERLVKILDFGLAKLSEVPADAQKLTQAGTVFGTPRYMSPEQATADKIDARSDLYSVGVILYEMLTGRALFEGDTVVEIMTKQVTATPAAMELKDTEPFDPAALETTVLKALAKRPEDRFQDAREFRESLAASAGASLMPATAVGLASQANGAFAPTMVRGDSVAGLELRGPGWRASRRRKMAVGAIGLVAVAAGLTFFATQPRGLEAAEAALANGDVASADRLTHEYLKVHPESAKGYRVLGHIAFERNKTRDGVADYKRALELDGDVAEDARFQLNVRRLVDRRDKSVAPLVRSVSKHADKDAEKLLVYLVQEVPSKSLRRVVYEGLERLGRTEALDRFEYLRQQLSKNPSDDCQTRRWYVSRLAALDDARALPLFEAELRRKGGFLDLERTSDCMREMLTTAINKHKDSK